MVTDAWGRLLITFLLCERGILRRPLLYLSHYFRQHQSEYYDRLQAIRDAGDWERWLIFFLQGVRDVSIEATETARRIVSMREEHRHLITDKLGGSIGSGLALLDALYMRPIVTVPRVADITNLKYPNANNLVNRFEELGLLHETTGQRRNRRFAYKPYLDLLSTPLTSS